MPAPKARKKDYVSIIGDVTQDYYEFLNKLWNDATGDAFRASLLAASQPELRTLLAGLPLINDDPILVVDIENGKTNGQFDRELGAVQGFYVLMLPPRPVRNPGEPHYRMMQQWGAAYYHAINESYGM